MTVRLGEPHSFAQGVVTVRTPTVQQTGAVPILRHPSSVGVLALALAWGLTGCAPDGGPPAGAAGGDVPPAPTVPAPPSPRPTPDASTVVIRSGDVELTVSSPRPPDVEPGDTSTTASLDIGPEGPATLTADGGRTFAVNTDGTVTVLDDDGTPVAGLTAPSGGARFVPGDGSSVHLVAEAAGTATTTLGSRAVAATAWGDREGGPSLAVAPTDWARTAGAAGEDLVRTELVAADPQADTATMRDQLTCHAVGAPDKATWNLEPWRPDVGLAAVLAARCNPTA